MIPIEVLKRVAVVYSHENCPDGIASTMILKDAFRILGTSPRIEFLAHGTIEHRIAANCTSSHVPVDSACKKYQRGMVDGRCVYCDHEEHCHPGPGATCEIGSGEEASTIDCNIALFCDIAPHVEAAEHARLAGAIVLDHHKSAEELVRSFGELGVFADEKLEPGVSGAVLAFREVWVPARNYAAKNSTEWTFQAETNTKDFAECVGARDTWQTKDPRFQRGQWISKMLMSKPASYWFDYQMGHDGSRHPPYLTDSEVEIGCALFEAHEEAVRQAVDQCVEYSFATNVMDSMPPHYCGVRLLVFQEQASGFRLTSDVAEAIRQERGKATHDATVVAGFSYVVDKSGGEPRLLYSLRGLNGFDVAAFAKANGGGGHTAAAGFSIALRTHGCVTMTDPYEEVRRRLETFLITGAGTRS